MTIKIFRMNNRFHWVALHKDPRLMGAEKTIAESPRKGFKTLGLAIESVNILRAECALATVVCLEGGLI